MMKWIPILLVILASGCSSFRFPGVHRITIQQGNVITQTMIDKLKPGMSKSQVRFIMGNAVLDDPFDQDRWDYVYTIQIDGGTPVVRELSLFFVEDRLSHFEGNYLPTEEESTASASNT